MTDQPPFIIFALPRSRTYWLSRFLTHGAWTCWHEQFPRFRAIDDVKAWFSQNNTGASETTGAPHWRTILDLRPDIRVLVIRRPVDEVMDSLMRIDLEGVCAFDAGKMRAEMERLDRKLDQIERRIPNALSVRFADLASPIVCARLWRHCRGDEMPYDRWAGMDQRNLQVSVPAQMRYMLANASAIARLTKTLEHRALAKLAWRPPTGRDDIVMQRESTEDWYRDGKHLLREHSIELGEGPDGYEKKNWKLMHMMDKLGCMRVTTARCNGRMIAYHAAIVSPAMDDATLTSSLDVSIFASKDFPGVGRRLQRFAWAALRESGVGALDLRAGVNADGERMSAVYKRAGAVHIGRVYRLDLRSH